jgi:hypothetical protein
MISKEKVEDTNEEKVNFHVITLNKIDDTFPDNKIKTSKYSFWNFVPMNLLLQF